MSRRGEAGQSRADRLVEAAIGLLEAGGLEAVQVRKVAAEVGISTMGVYTHFGGLAELTEAMAAEGFRRFGDHVAAIPETADPMADFFAKGIAYRQWAVANPQLYRLMFGLAGSPLRPEGQDLTVTGTISSLPEGQAAFDVMVGALERVKASGKIDQVDTVAAAGQFLSATHGYVLLEIAGYFGPGGSGFAWVFGPLGLSVMVGLGATRKRAEKAAISALASFGIL